ncbi:MAG: type III pantothenate kinase [Hyphomicrobium sp.]|nr:type III pantothenate kinase [Hyphomicrobium sp.]
MLLLDIGNTRLKWAHFTTGRLRSGGAVAHGGDPAAALAALELAPPESIRIASVAGTDNERAVEELCMSRWQQAPRFARAERECLGLRNGYAAPERLGVDRWIAMLAAWSTQRAACVVVDAGTALTVDVIDAQGQHLGGLIAAGLHTSELAVLGATRFPTRVQPLTTHDGLGLDTEACVRQGAMLSVLGAIDRACSRAPAAQQLITGGDAETLLPFLGTGWTLRPDLVFEGLLALN